MSNDMENQMTTKSKVYKLSPILNDETNPLIVDTKEDVLACIAAFFDNEMDIPGDSFTVEVLEMTDDEIDALPESNY